MLNRILTSFKDIWVDENGVTLATTYSFSANTLIVAAQFNTNFTDIEAVVNALTADNLAADCVGKVALATDVIRAGYGLVQHTDGALYVDVSDTNPSLEISDGGLRVLVDDSTIERTASGLAIKDDGVTTDSIKDANVTAAKLASDSVTTAKIADNNVTTAKILALNVTVAKLAADVTAYFYKSSGSSGNSGNSPTSWTDLDLSSIVGANKALVFLSVTPSTGESNKYAFRTNGSALDTSSILTADAYDSGLAGGYIVVNETLFVMVETDASGVVEWIASAAVTTSVIVIGYMKAHS